MNRLRKLVSCLAEEFAIIKMSSLPHLCHEPSLQGLCAQAYAPSYVILSEGNAVLLCIAANTARTKVLLKI